jgi:plastocyanin
MTMNSWQTTTTIWLAAFVAIAGVLTGAVVWQTSGPDGNGQAIQASDAVPGDHEADDSSGAAHEAEEAGDAVHEDDDHDAIGHGADDADDAVHEENGGDHDHAVGIVDAEAPEIELQASEFSYDVTNLEIEAGQPVTIVLHNDGFLEHDITIEGFEALGGAHTQPGEVAAFTVAIDQPGEYRYYCTIPGHLEAGMEGLLTVK